jgi:hypothetical protein
MIEDEVVTVHNSNRWAVGFIMLLGVFYIFYGSPEFMRDAIIIKQKNLGFAPIFIMLVSFVFIIIWFLLTILVLFGKRYLHVKDKYIFVCNKIFSFRVGAIRKYIFDEQTKMDIVEKYTVSKGMKRKFFQILIFNSGEKEVLLSGFTSSNEAQSILNDINKLILR